MSKKKRFCVDCKSQNTKKYGQARGVQRYRCNDCGRQFNDERRKKNVLVKQLWKEYCFKKQTIRELSQSHGKDKRTIRKLLDGYIPPEKVHHPRSVHIVVDATYFGERTNESSWCVTVVREPKRKEDLVWAFGETEKTSLYSDLREQLERAGYTIVSVTGDGFNGIRSAFRGIPFQMCHVHMERLVTRGTTRKPQTETGQVLLALIKTLHQTNSHIFITRLTKYLERYQQFLSQKTRHVVSGEWSWSHENLRRASLSLVNLKRYVFTFEHNKHIPKTTNSLEGRFSHIKDVLGVHRGLTRPHKQKLIHSILLASTIAPTKKKLNEIL